MTAVRDHAILDHMQTGVLVCTRDLAVVHMNSAAEQMLNLSESRAHGEPIVRLLPHNSAFLSHLREAITTGQPITLRETALRIQGVDEDITVDCTATPMPTVTDSVGELLVEIIAVDRVMRLARESAWLDAHAANQAVIRGVAHEIKNPLGGLRGAAQLLERQLEEPELHEYTGIIISEADRLRNLVDRMGAPARAFDPKKTNIHEILEHVRSLLLADSPADVRIARDYDPSLPMVPVEAPLMIQAVINIVKNALEAVGPQGVVTLRTRIDRQVTIGRQRHRQVLRLDITDTGPGVPEELQDTLFYPLVTGRADGTGLGLSITQEIVSRHSGLMNFISEPGHTCFTIFLPIDIL